jgi:ribosome-associated protein
MASNKKNGGGRGPKIHSSHHGDVFKAGGGKAKGNAPRMGRSPRAAGGGGGGPKMKKARTGAAPSPSGSVASEAARGLAIAIAVAALEKKAVGLEILDVAGKVDYADFLVIMTGRSDRQVSALAQGIEEALKKKGVRALAVEGLPHASWVLMDFGDVVVHVFQDDARNLYDIEGLWLDARRLPVPAPGPEDMR